MGLVDGPGFVVVPLLSREGLTRRLLPGATAPFPALDQELTKFPAPAGLLTKFSAPARNCFDFALPGLPAEIGGRGRLVGKVA